MDDDQTQDGISEEISVDEIANETTDVLPEEKKTEELEPQPPVTDADGNVFDGRYLYRESYINLDPNVAFYLNGIMGVVLMTGSSLLYFLGYTGD